MRNQILSFIQKLIICIFIFFIGFLLGKQSQIKSSSDKITKVNNDFAKEKIEYKKQLDDLTAWKENRGILIDTKQYTYNKNSIGVYSPLLVDKIVEISTYKYRGK